MNFAPLAHLTLRSALALACSVALLASQRAWAQADLEELEEQAMRAAVENVSGSVIQIVTTGGLDRQVVGRGSILFGTGPTTGLVVSEDGYIITSAFNFASKPSGILVKLPDGTSTPARQIATDHNRMLTLLKINDDVGKLPMPEISPASEMRVGQWALAVGRTFENQTPNMSVGIVSALERIDGKAIQTDAKCSPNNYGGPLVDIRGRVLGVIVPLSPRSTGEIAGVEWYDSGIGFAMPAEEIMRVLPRLRQGEDLHRGVMGINFSNKDQLSGEPEIVAVRAGSPASEAGLKAGDVIVEVDGVKVTTSHQARNQVVRRYAGDTLKLAVMRKDERIETELTLVAKLEPYEHPFLGVLPLRLAAKQADGMHIRHVYPQSPAAKAGLRPGDVITKIGEKEVARSSDAISAMESLKPGQQTELTIRRQGTETALKPTLTTLPDAIIDELPVAHPEPSEDAGDIPEVGVLRDQRLAGYENEYLAYVPRDYHPDVPHGVVVWLHKPGDYNVDDIIGRFKSYCDKYDLILLAPKCADPSKWQPTDVEFLAKMVDDAQQSYTVDPTRIVAHGFQQGGTMAFLFAFRRGGLVTAVAAVDSPVTSAPPENEPTHRLAIYLTTAGKAPQAAQIQRSIQGLKNRKFPVTVVEQGDGLPRRLNEEELDGLFRWIDALDRI